MLALSLLLLDTRSRYECAGFKIVEKQQLGLFTHKVIDIFFLVLVSLLLSLEYD